MISSYVKGNSLFVIMASLRICNRVVHGKSYRLVLNFVNLKGNSSNLKEEVTKLINLPPSDIGNVPNIHSNQFNKYTIGTNLLQLC